MYGYVSKKNVIMYRFTVNNYCEPVNDLTCTSTLYIIRERKVCMRNATLSLGVSFKFTDQKVHSNCLFSGMYTGEVFCNGEKMDAMVSKHQAAPRGLCQLCGKRFSIIFLAFSSASRIQMHKIHTLR